MMKIIHTEWCLHTNHHTQDQQEWQECHRLGRDYPHREHRRLDGVHATLGVPLDIGDSDTYHHHLLGLALRRLLYGLDAEPYARG